MLARTWQTTPRLCTRALSKPPAAATAILCEHRKLSRRLHQRAEPTEHQSSPSTKPKVSRSTAKPARRKTASPLPPPKEFVYVAIDGDACPFHQDLMVRGRIGGYAAVEQLIKEVKHLFGLASDDLTDVIVQIFVNQRGHISYAWNRYRVHKEVSSAFFEGLNQADPILNVVNVGTKKEAADLKIRDFHMRLPGCRKIALAGLADGGYAGLLRSFISRGQRNRIVLLKTSENIAADIKEIAHGLSQSPDDKYGLAVAPLPSDLFQPEALPPPPL